MKSTFKKLPKSKIELEVVLDQKEFLDYWNEANAGALSKVHLKGFRPGTAPKELAEQAVDKEKVFNEAANNAVRYSLDEIIKKNNWILIDSPQVEVEESKLGLKYKVFLTVFPDVQLGNYKKIAKKIFSEVNKRKKEIKIEPQEVDKALEWLRQSRKQSDNVPELNDEFAKSVGGFKDLQELRSNIANGLTTEKEYREQDLGRIKFLEEVVKDSKIDMPEIMIEKTLDQMAGDKKELREKLRSKAENHVAANLVLYKIAEAEKIDYNTEKGVDNERIFQYLESLATK